MFYSFSFAFFKEILISAVPLGFASYHVHLEKWTLKSHLCPLLPC